jgi:hypothetical protein
MITSLLGFFELGAIILAWTIFWNWFLTALLSRYKDHPAVQGLAAIYLA